MTVDLDEVGKKLAVAVHEAGAGLHGLPAVVRGGINPATCWDRDVDQSLRRSLVDIVKVPVFSEERSPGGIKGKGRCWVVDPIDGTLNAMVGSPEFAVSVALVDRSNLDTLAAAVYLPHQDTLYEAIQGRPAYVDGKVLDVRTAGEAPQIAAFGVPHDSLAVADHMAGALRYLMREGWVTRQTGAASIDICRVASGQWRGFFEYRLQYWDFAAAALIAEQAGCTVRRWVVGAGVADALPLEYDLIVASDEETAKPLEAAMTDGASAAAAHP